MSLRYTEAEQYYEELGRVGSIISKVEDVEASVMFRLYRHELELELFALQNPHMVHYTRRR